MKHADMIARLEAADVGDVRLSLDVLYAVVGEEARKIDQHSVTTSLDAAIALADRVLPVFKYWALGTNGGEEFVATVAASSTAPHGWDGVAKTPALAICIAILKALESQ